MGQLVISQGSVQVIDWRVSHSITYLGNMENLQPVQAQIVCMAAAKQKNQCQGFNVP